MGLLRVPSDRTSVRGGGRKDSMDAHTQGKASWGSSETNAVSKSGSHSWTAGPQRCEKINVSGYSVMPREYRNIICYTQEAVKLLQRKDTHRLNKKRLWGRERLYFGRVCKKPNDCNTKVEQYKSHQKTDKHHKGSNNKSSTCLRHSPMAGVCTSPMWPHIGQG